LLVVGVIAVMVGAQLSWGEVDLGQTSVPLTFFLDIGAIGSLLSVIGIALGGLSPARADLGALGRWPAGHLRPRHSNRVGGADDAHRPGSPAD
jgi:hypothetical protein